MELEIISAILFAAGFLGALRKKAAYGVLVIICSIIFRANSDVGTDLWWASCLFILVGAGMVTFLPIKNEEKEEA